MAVTERGWSDQQPPQRGPWRAIGLVFLIGIVGIGLYILLIRPRVDRQGDSVIAYQPPPASSPAVVALETQPPLSAEVEKSAASVIRLRGGPEEVNRQLAAAGLQHVVVPRNARSIDLALTPTPFWPAMEKLARAIGQHQMVISNGQYRFSSGGKLAMVDFDLPHASDQGVYAEYSPRFSFTGPRTGDDTATLSFRIRPAPGMELVSAMNQLDVTLAEDDSGRSLLAMNPSSRTFIAERNSGTLMVRTPIKLPANGSERLAKLHANLDVEVAASVVRARFEKPLTPGAQFTAGGFEFRSKELGVSRLGWPKLVVEVRRTGDPPDVLQGDMYPLVTDMQLRLVTADGKPVGNPGSASTQRGFVQVDIERVGKQPFPEPVFLLADVPQGVKPVRLQLQFDDLALPTQLEKQ